MPKRWYIVHTESRFEQAAADAIRAQLAERGLSELVEEIARPPVRADAQDAAARRFHPGYLLVKCDLTDEVRGLIGRTPKVTGFLGPSDQPLAISDAEARRMIY